MSDSIGGMVSAYRSHRTTAPSDWQTVAFILLATGFCIVGLYWATVRSMIEVWSSSRTFVHGFLIMPLSLYLIYAYRSQVASLVPSPSWRGLAALSLAGFGWVAGHYMEAIRLQQASVVVMLGASAWAVLGTDITRRLAWPLGFMGFMIPAGVSLEPWLQQITVNMILVGLRLFGIPYVEDKYSIGLSSGTWDVAPDCGGLRYLLPGLVLGYAFVTLIYRRPARRILFLLLCGGVFILANGVRAFGIIALDHLGIVEGADHRFFSYTIYGLTVFLLFRLGLGWEERAWFDTSDGQPTETGRRLPVRETALMALGTILILALGPALIWIMGGLR